MHSSATMKARLSLFLTLLLTVAAHAAKLTFEDPVKEVTAELNDREITIDFPFSNKSDEAVTIQRYEAACTCTSVKVKGGKMRYEPGEEGVIRTVFDIGNFIGDTSKAIQLWVEGDSVARPSVILQAKIHIPVLVEVEPKTLRWEPEDAPEVKTIVVTMHQDDPIQVTGVGCSNESFTTELKTLEAGKRYEIDVKPTATDTPALGIITIQTDCEVARHANQRAFAMVRKLPKVPGKGN